MGTIFRLPHGFQDGDPLPSVCFYCAPSSMQQCCVRLIVAPSVGTIFRLPHGFHDGDPSTQCPYCFCGLYCTVPHIIADSISLTALLVVAIFRLPHGCQDSRPFASVCNFRAPITLRR